MSPIFLFAPRFRGDAWLLHLQRLGVLVKYGEGPHMSALARSSRLPSLAGAGGPRPWATAAAAIFSAGVASNNFYGATALANFIRSSSWPSGSRGSTSASRCPPP